ncbi:class I SAM-dependent methyltransferase [Salinarimonas rosea]|uniref:class I SAM-dependent methyltransferase n=1 Tax=Salinarimonas rosea TaxID=552063 RepID=UPI0003FA4A24|nr:class I SAM-dependent methyltransferase [Salinarimonas rosea]
MSGFSPDWLDLREPADHRARDRGLEARLASCLADRDAVHVVDLGCGLGSNLRGLYRALPARQSWRLVDHDPALLAGARIRLAAWADVVLADGADGLSLEKNGRRLDVAFAQADLSNDLDAALGEAPDLVTAAALFDLCGEAFIARFARAVVAREALFHTVLTYDGREAWEPPHPLDAAFRAAFVAHQGEDKGFGTAAGPAATRRLASAFAGEGYATHLGVSPWRLVAPRDAALIRALAEGQASAVAETGRLATVEVEAWRAARVAASAATIGHADLFCRP